MVHGAKRGFNIRCVELQFIVSLTLGIAVFLQHGNSMAILHDLISANTADGHALNDSNVPVMERSNAEHQPFIPQDLLRVLLRRHRLFLAVLLAVFAAGMVYTLTKPRIYQSTAKILVATSQGHGSSQIALLSELEAMMRSRSVETQVEVISSPDLIDGAYQELSHQDRLEGFGALKHPPDGAVMIFPKRDTEVIQITVLSQKPDASARLANLIAEKYFDLDLAHSNQAIRKARVYVEEQLDKVRTELAEANSNLSRFKTQSGLFSSEAQLLELAKRLAFLQTEVDQSRAAAAADGNSLEGVQQLLGKQQQYLVTQTTITENPRVRDSLATIDSLLRERTSLLQEYTETSPEVQALDARIASENARVRVLTAEVIASQVKTRNAVYDGLYQQSAELMASKLAHEQRVRSLTASLNQLSAELRTLPKQEQQLAMLMQRAAFLQSTVTMLTDKLYTLRLSEHGRLQNGRLIATARSHDVPVKPRVATNALIALILGVMCALLCVVLLERIDDRVHDPHLTASYAEAVLAEIPRVPESQSFILDQADTNAGLLESFRLLRNNISFISIDKPLKTIAITSAGVSEGKSSISANLAYVMALEGKRVVVVECDLRRPAQHIIGNLPRETGLTNVVTGVQSIENVIQRSPRGNYDVILAGPPPPNPPEVLNSQQMRNIVKSLASQYDIVIVDSPPTAGLSDVPVISTFVDALLFVVRMDVTSNRLLRKSLRELALAKAPFCGLIVNNVNFRHFGYGYGYGYYHDSHDTNINHEGSSG
ncbi:MAG: GumC family protein [Armatimonadota bacterium]